jgi:hypothetical protein
MLNFKNDGLALVKGFTKISADALKVLAAAGVNPSKAGNLHGSFFCPDDLFTKGLLVHKPGNPGMNGTLVKATS